MASLVFASSAGAARITAACVTAPAPRLCTIHAHVSRTNQLRQRMGLRPLAYGWMAERYPARCGLYLRYWTRVHHATYLRWVGITVTPVGIIRHVFGSAADAAISVARCESGLDPFAHNPSGAAGLFQLMPVHWEAQGYDPYDAGTNTRIAWHLYEHSGWSAWICQP